MTRFEDGVTRSPSDAPEKSVLGGRIETPFIYKVYGTIEKKIKYFPIFAKKLKGLNMFFNTLSLFYRNINRKALKRLLFFYSVVF